MANRNRVDFCLISALRLLDVMLRKAQDAARDAVSDSKGFGEYAECETQSICDFVSIALASLNTLRSSIGD